LSDLYNAITDDSAHQSGTEYEYESEDTYRIPYNAAMGVVDDADEDPDEDEEMDVLPVMHHNGAHGGYQVIRESTPQYIPVDVQQAQYPTRELFMTRERASRPVSRNSPGYISSSASTPVSGPPSRRGRGGFGHQPIVEASTSPTPSEAASNRSGGTNHSTGTAFFRNYVEAAASTRAGVITPDLVFAEIGHGRGAGSILGSNGQFSPRREQPIASPQSPTYPVPSRFLSMQTGASSSHIPILEEDSHQANGNGYPVLADASNSYRHPPQRTDSGSSWTQIQHEETDQSIPSSPSLRDIHEPNQLLHRQRGHSDGWDVDGRGRSFKRSLRNTINGAEHYASSFLFGRGSNISLPDGQGSSASHSVPTHSAHPAMNQDVDQQGQ
jgi:F-box and leucine-rich repeat protein GRR1